MDHEQSGIILIGVIFNTYPFGLVSGQNPRLIQLDALVAIKDPLWLKAMVCSMVITDTVHSISLIYMTITYFVRNFANPALHKLVVSCPYTLTPMMTAIAAVIIQTFLAYRIYCLTHNRVIFGVISATAVVFFIMACVNCALVLRISLVTTNATNIHVIIGTIASSFQIAIDLTILVILMYHLWVARRRSTRTNLTTVVSRLMAGAIQTGTFGALFALMTQIAVYAFPTITLYTFFAFSTARLYTYTLMHTLNAREGLRGLLDQSHVSFHTFEGTNR